MRRTPGWIILAGIALEVAALAFLSHYVYDDARRAEGRRPVARIDDERVQDAPEIHEESTTAILQSPLDFLKEPDDAQAQYYRASDTSVELVAAFYADGRVRLADELNGRFAGMLQNGHADLLDIANNLWSELFLRTTPQGRIQLELRGGPYDAHVLTCEALSA